MADFKKRLSQNVDGEFFVDSTCVNCDTCRQLAPATFGDTGDYAYVRAQPVTEVEAAECSSGAVVLPGHGQRMRLSSALRSATSRR